MQLIADQRSDELPLIASCAKCNSLAWAVEQHLAGLAAPAACRKALFQPGLGPCSCLPSLDRPQILLDATGLVMQVMVMPFQM